MESLLFAPLPKKRLRLASIAGSASAHALVLTLLGVVTRYTSPPADEVVDWSQFRVEFIRFHPTAPLFAPTRDGLGTVPVELPSRPLTKAGPVVLQPEYRPKVKNIPVSLPALASWSPVVPAHPKSEIITPGYTQRAAPPELAATSVLAPSNREPVLRDANVALQQPASAPRSPALQLSNGSTMPIQAPAAHDSRAGSLANSAGQPSAVIAFGDGPSNTQVVEVAEGLQIVPGSRRSNSNGFSASGAGVFDPLRALVVLPTAAASNANSTMATTRIQHPVNGSFDVVIMESAPREESRFAEMRLNGGPVYTVYLPVGDRKEWLLQYGAPAAVNVQASPYQVYLDDEGSVAPPYPITTVIPTSVVGEGFGARVVLRGFLTAAGALENVRTSSSANSLVQGLLSLIADWRFRPATRNRKPIGVEVLLVIPARS